MKFFCICGKRFRSLKAEAVHRHNFPALCKKKTLKEIMREAQERAEFSMQMNETNPGADMWGMKP